MILRQSENADRSRDFRAALDEAVSSVRSIDDVLAREAAANLAIAAAVDTHLGSGFRTTVVTKGRATVVRVDLTSEHPKHPDNVRGGVPTNGNGG